MIKLWRNDITESKKELEIPESVKNVYSSQSTARKE